MAKNEIDSLTIGVSLDTEQLKKSAKNAEVAINDFGTKVKNSLNTFITAGIGAAALAISKNLVTGFANAGSKLYFLSQSLNENVSTLDAWGRAATKMGGTADGLYGSINNLFMKIQGMRFGGDMQTASLFSYLGINLRNSKGEIKETTEIFTELADKFKGMDVGKRNYVGAMLGIDPATIRLLGMGRKEVEAYLGQIKQQGVMSQKQAEEATKAKQRIDDMNQAYERLKINLGEQLLPVFEKVSAWIINFIQNTVPQLIAKFQEFQKALGLSNGAIINLSAAFAGLAVALPVLKGIGSALGLISTNAGLALTPLGRLVSLVSAGLFIDKETQKLTNNKGLNQNLQTQSGGATGGYMVGNQFIPTGTTTDKLKSLKSGNNKPNGGIFSKDFWNDVIDALAPAQMQKESGGNPNAIGDKGKSFGSYQIQIPTASEALGRPVSANELLDPEFNRKVRDLIMKKGLEKSGGDIAGALAYYNGGQGGLNHYKRTGQSYNNYAESIMQNSQMMAQSVAKPQISKSQSSNMTIHNLHLPNVTNPQNFADEMSRQALLSGFSFSSGIIA